MGGGGSRLKKDDAPPPPAAAGGGGGGGGGKGAGKDKTAASNMPQAMIGADKKALMKQQAKMEEVVSDGSDDEGAYDSDLERQLEREEKLLAEQEGDDDHKRLAIQDRARNEALQWTSLVLPPQDFVPDEKCEYKPEEAITLDFVHGYRGWDCNNNVFFTIADEVAYFVGSLGVVLEPSSRRQKHYSGPPNRSMKEVMSMAMHPAGSIVATGEFALAPHILIWDLSTLATLKDLSGVHEGGISALAFSKDGKRLASAGMEKTGRTVSVWDWKNDKKTSPICSQTLKTPKIIALAFNPRDDVLVACGVNMIEFLRIGLSRTGQRVLEHLPGLFTISNLATQGMSPSMLCAAFTKTEFSLTTTIRNAVEGLCLTGSDIGNIYLWKREEQIDMIVSAHRSSVHAIVTFVNGFCSGGKDGKVRVWSNDLEPLNSFDISAVLQQDVIVKSVDQRQGRILVGTHTCSILDLDQDTGEAQVVIEGHMGGAVEAVACHPTKPLYASGGADRYLRFWNLVDKVLWKKKMLDHPIKSLCFSPDGKVIAAGHALGSWSVHRVDSLDEVITSKDRKKSIFCVKFAPSGRYLAVGSEDSMVDLYDCASDYDWVATLQGHAASVLHLDWSIDSRFLQSCGSEQDLLFWNVEEQTLIPGFEETCDIEWDSYSSTVGWSVQGLVGTGLANTSCSRSLSGHLLASGNTDAMVRLFRFPCIVQGAEANMCSGHVGTVMCVRFTCDDTFVISCGSEDRCVYQWRVTSDRDVGYDALDSETLKTLENMDVAIDRRKDVYEQSRIDKRLSRLEAERVPIMDPGKDIPKKEMKQRGKEGVRGNLSSQEEKEEGGEEEKAPKPNMAPEKPGIPEQLPDLEEGFEEVAEAYDSDLERERKMRYHRGPQTSVSAEEREVDEDGFPVTGEPLFVLKPQTMAVPPTKYRKPDDADEPPLGGLQMEFIYGARMHDTRNCAQYTGHGHIVFLAGATGVVYNPIQHTQKFFNGHTDDVICLSLHPDFITAATGQVGRKALLCVWNTYTMQTLSVIRGFHDYGICSVSFNSDGSLLASVGMDVDHSIAVWDWKTGQKRASATGHVNRIFCIAFNPSDDSLVSAGVGHIKFWTISGRLLRGQQGKFTQGDKKQVFCSLTVSKKGRIFTGSERGEIYRWKNGDVDSVINAHHGPVFALWVCRDGLCSGGKDGMVKVWSLALKPLVEFDMRTQSTGVDNSKVRSVCWLVRTILVGTIDNELFEIDIEAGAPKLLLQGHRSMQVNGLATHPSKRLFVTGGDDHSVRLWDMDSRKQIGMRMLEDAVSSVSVSLDGNHIACGLRNGKLVILKLRTMRPHLERKDRKLAILEVKYSANGKFLAAGGGDCFIDIYDVQSEYEWIGTCAGHKGSILALDWSADSKQIQSDDERGNHLYWDVESSKEILVAAEVRDVEWSSWTTRMGWSVQGIASKFQGPMGINTTCRSSFGDTLATGDDWGMLKLFRFPCITPGAKSKRYGGHSARVGKVRFSFEEKTVLSSGLVDGLVVQWRYLSSGKLLEAEQELSDDEDEMEMEKRVAAADDKVDSDVENELGLSFGRGESEVKVDKSGMLMVKSERMVTGKEQVVKGRSSTKMNVKNGVDLNAELDPREMEKKAGKDWRKPMDADEAPYNCLQLEHVYGYRGHDCRNNLMYNEEGNLVYMVGAVGVVYRKEGHMQVFYSGHTDDVISLAMHPDKVLVASGQVGKSPVILVWSSVSMQTLSTLRGFHELGVAAMSFNKDGTKLASVGLDVDHSIAIWDWKKGTRIASSPGHTDKIMEARFNPVDDVLVTCGIRHIKFWSMYGDNQMRSKKGVYGQEGVQYTMLCVSFTDAGLSLTGGESGDIFLWKGTHLEWQFEQAHKGPVFALSTYPDGFVSGGKDGRVRLWSGLDPVKVFDFSTTTVTSILTPRIRSACWHDGHVLVGTMSNEIFEVDERNMTQRLLTQSHAGADVWGLDTHPKEDMFATGGEDHTVRVFKVASRKPSMVRELNGGVKCVAYNHDGMLLAAGLVDGQVIIMETRKLTPMHEKRSREETITDIKFSPDGIFLATTCIDGSLDIYDSTVEFELIGSASTTQGCSLIHLDWSTDGRHIQTDNSMGMHQYWDSSSLVEQVGADEVLGRADWHTWTCVSGWSVQGLIPKMSEPSGINAVARSHRRDVLAVANDFGLVRLYRYPCPYVGSKHKRYAGHSSLVANCRFTFNDKYLITVGAKDRAIMQWEHISD